VNASVDHIVERESRYWVVEREPGLETIAFFSAPAGAVTAELAALARDTRLAAEAPTPGLSLVPAAEPDAGGSP
jgi:hypothetical protein